MARGGKGSNPHPLDGRIDAHDEVNPFRVIFMLCVLDENARD